MQPIAGFAPVQVPSVSLAVFVGSPAAVMFGLFVFPVAKQIQSWCVIVSQAHLMVNLGIEPVVFGVWLAAQVVCSYVFFVPAMCVLMTRIHFWLRSVSC